MTTTNLGMTKPTVGADSDTWGGELNADLDLIDAFAGKLMPGAEVTVASAATCDIGAAASTAVAISGTATITSFGTVANCIRFVRFTGALTLTHNATSLILLGGANHTTVAGDTAIYRSDVSGNWREVTYSSVGYIPSAHTGTGSFVHATSPSFTAPLLGAAIATSLAINGATLGSNAISVNGDIRASGIVASVAGNVEVPGGQFRGDGGGGSSLSVTGFGLNQTLSCNGLSSTDVGFGCAINVVAHSNGVLLSKGASSWSAISDERTKTDFVPIVDASNKVASLRAITGRYKTDEISTRRAFLIAQDVQSVLPEAVTVYTNKADASDPSNGNLVLAYTDVIPLLVAALKELNVRIGSLEARFSS